jgi:hypothetical protein
MKVSDFWTLLGAILFIALIATVLTKKNTSGDITASGKAFTGALGTAEKG